MVRMHLRKSTSRWINLRYIVLFCLVLVVCLHLYLATILTKRIVHVGSNAGDLEDISNSNGYVSADSGGIVGDSPVKSPDFIQSSSSAQRRYDSLHVVDHKVTIAYAISLTSCSADSIDDGAAVLKHSIALASFPLNKSSKYQYKIYAFVHPDAMECSKSFELLGYEVQVKNTPIDVTQIKGDFLREKVVKTGCCQEKEFLKLYSYTLTEHPVVVHLDLDSLILAPLDDLFDAMLDGDSERLPVMHNKSIPEKIEAFYTKDYNMVKPGHKHPGVQGGFIVVKPNMDYFEEYQRVILEGNFIPGGGWAGKWGGYYGAQQIQGLCSYFFEGLHPGTAVELNRCIYNNMNDNPKGKKRGRNPEGLTVCIDGKPTCEDCRTTPIDKVKSVHFTICQKPWNCPLYVLGNGLCKSFHSKWFEIRKNWEETSGSATAIQYENVNFHNDVFHGYCTGNGRRNYKPVNLTI